jgi:hypothetical protein
VQKSKLQRDAELLGPFVAEALEQDLSQGPNAPLYQSTALWGALEVAVAIVVTVLAAMIRDVRWLLWLAVPFLSFAAWEFASHFNVLRKSKLILTFATGAVSIAALAWLYIALRPEAQSVTNVPPFPTTATHSWPPAPIPPKILKPPSSALWKQCPTAKEKNKIAS